MKHIITETLKLGIDAHQSGKFLEAEEYYKSILKVHPQHPDANHNIGVLFVICGKNHEALSRFRLALEANPKIAQYWISYIDLLISFDRLSDAKAVLSQARKLGAKGDKFDRLIEKIKAKEMSSNSKRADAETPLVEELSSSPFQELDQAFGHADHLIQKGMLQEAKKIYSHILKKYPGDKRAHKCLEVLEKGNATLTATPLILPRETKNQLLTLINQNNFKLCCKLIEDLLEKFSRSSELYNIYGVALRGQRKLDASIKAFKRAVDLDPCEPTTHNNMCIVLIELKRYEEAVTSSEVAINLKSDFAEAHVNRGDALRFLRDLPLSIEAYQNAIALKPDYFKAYYNMAVVLESMGNLSDAERAYLEALKLKTNSVDAHVNLGNIYLIQGKLDKAIGIYECALSIFPSSFRPLNNKGLAYKKKGQLPEAIEAFKQALSVEPASYKAYTNLGTAYHDSGNYEKAINAYSKALEINPDFTDAFNNMANSLLEQGKIEECLNAFAEAIYAGSKNESLVVNMVRLDTQLADVSSQFASIFARKDVEDLLKTVKLPKYYVLDAIRCFISAQFDRAEQQLRNFKACEKKLFDTLVEKDKLFCVTFSRFLEKLLINFSANKAVPKAENTIYHIGESHCLSYAHYTLIIDDQSFKIKPLITFGAKSYHFGGEDQNSFKAITSANLSSVPRNSKIFISFGEIDCRPDEGFIAASQKLKRTVHDVIATTVSEYLDWFAAELQNSECETYFLNVPAPVYREKLSDKENTGLADTIIMFNAQLEKMVSQYDFGLINVHKFTANENNFSNGIFHIDSVHLGPNAICKIEEQFKI